MAQATIEDVQANLPEILSKLPSGEELVITQGDRVIARLVGERPRRTEPRVLGLARGMLTIVAEDDEHLADFAESMS